MSKLEFFSRPLVAFDAANKEHRAIYYQFVKRRGWGHSPYRFIVPDDQGADLITMIQRSMIEYYIHREFGENMQAPEVEKIRPTSSNYRQNG